MTLIDNFGKAFGCCFFHVQVGDDQNVLVVVRSEQESLRAANVKFIKTLYNVRHVQPRCTTVWCLPKEMITVKQVNSISRSYYEPIKFKKVAIASFIAGSSCIALHGTQFTHKLEQSTILQRSAE